VRWADQTYPAASSVHSLEKIRIPVCDGGVKTECVYRSRGASSGGPLHSAGLWSQICCDWARQRDPVRTRRLPRLGVDRPRGQHDARLCLMRGAGRARGRGGGRSGRLRIISHSTSRPPRPLLLDAEPSLVRDGHALQRVGLSMSCCRAIHRTGWHMDHQPAVVSGEPAPPCGIFDNLRFIARLSLGIKAQFRGDWAGCDADRQRMKSIWSGRRK
jgi:hypothetical protein